MRCVACAVFRYRTADGDGGVATDVWAYPAHNGSGSVGAAPTNNAVAAYPYPQSAYGDAFTHPGAAALAFNPQGFAYTVAGDGAAGYKDGAASAARFRGPQDVAVDQGR